MEINIENLRFSLQLLITITMIVFGIIIFIQQKIIRNLTKSLGG